MSPEPTMAKASFSEKMKALLAEYGKLLLIIHFSLFFLVWGAMIVAILLGFQPEGAAAGTGTVFAAYAATQLTKPLRWAATAALTPLVSKLIARLRPVRTRE
ncbi:MAG: hypothetical protein ACOZIN_08180 [Myxococcota bacterium]